MGSIPLLQETGNLADAAAAHEELSRIYADQGRYEEAMQSVVESLTVSDAQHIPARIAQSKIQEARLHLVQNRIAEAEHRIG